MLVLNQASELAQLLRRYGLGSHVNLIPVGGKLSCSRGTAVLQPVVPL